MIYTPNRIPCTIIARGTSDRVQQTVIVRTEDGTQREYPKTLLLASGGFWEVEDALRAIDLEKPSTRRILTDREQERSAPDGQHPFGKHSLPAEFTPEEMAERERYADRRWGAA